MENLLFENEETLYEDIDMLEEETNVEKLSKTGSKKFNDSKVKKLIDEGKSLVKMIYTVKDEDFVEGKAFPMISRLLVRTIAITGMFMLHPAIGIIGFTTNKFLKKEITRKQRTRLSNFYKAKLEYIEDKLAKEEDDKEKYKLIKIRNSLNNNLKKIDTSISSMEK